MIYTTSRKQNGGRAKGGQLPPCPSRSATGFLVEVEKTNDNPYCISVCATRNMAKVDNSYCNTTADINLMNLQFPPLPARISVCLFLSNKSRANHKPLLHNKDSSFPKFLMLSLRRIKSCSYIHIWQTLLPKLKGW